MLLSSQEFPNNLQRFLCFCQIKACFRQAFPNLSLVVLGNFNNLKPWIFGGWGCGAVSKLPSPGAAAAGATGSHLRVVKQPKPNLTRLQEIRKKSTQEMLLEIGARESASGATPHRLAASPSAEGRGSRATVPATGSRLFRGVS